MSDLLLALIGAAAGGAARELLLWLDRRDRRRGVIRTRYEDRTHVPVDEQADVP